MILVARPSRTWVILGGALSADPGTGDLLEEDPPGPGSWGLIDGSVQAVSARSRRGSPSMILSSTGIFPVGRSGG
jgi:hypothetical protein